MKAIMYEWEDKYLLTRISKVLLKFDTLKNLTNFDKVGIKSDVSTSRNLDFAKLLSFNNVFCLNKSYLSLKESVDKNPLKLKSVNKKVISSNIVINSKSNSDALNSISYTYFVYLVNLFKSKNIILSRKIGKVYNTNLAELNSILKIGHSYNVLDIDPLIHLNFSVNLNKNSVQFYF